MHSGHFLRYVKGAESLVELAVVKPPGVATQIAGVAPPTNNILRTIALIGATTSIGGGNVN